MLDLLDDTNFTHVPNHAGTVLHGAPVRVLGSHTFQLEDSQPDACFAMCSAAEDCSGFTYLRTDGLCAFSGRSGRLIKPEKVQGDVFIKQTSHPDAVVPILPAMQPVSSSTSPDHHIFLVPDFASREECATLLQFAAACLARSKTAFARALPDDEDRAIVGSQSCPAAGPSAVLLARVEERIARLTGLPSHEGEETLSFRRSEAVGDDGHWFANVHHDKNKQPGRAATVILYLSSLNDTDGGHTIFPTLGRAGSEDDVDEFREAARLAYSQGRRALGCRDKSAGCGDVGGLVERARQECARALTGEHRGVAVRPQAGSALIFWSERPDGTPATDMWHTACEPRRTGLDSRWILQKFKTPKRVKHEGTARQGESGAEPSAVRPRAAPTPHAKPTRQPAGPASPTPVQQSEAQPHDEL